MSKIVAAFATSHTALMIRARDAADKKQVDNVMRGFEEVRRRLKEAAADVLIVIGSDHYKTFFLDNMPLFCIGIGQECEGWGEAGVPKYKVKVHQELARFLLREAIDSGFDLSFSLDMPLDHAFMCPLHFIMPEMDIPIVPLFQNSYAPPIPSPRRCYQLGEVLRRAIDKRPEKERVALLATGGLSHTVPISNWMNEPSDEFGPQRLEFMIHGKRQVDSELERQMLSKIKEFVDKELGRINESFDRKVLGLIAEGKYEALADYTYKQIEAEGGNGAQEIRNWITLLGAVPDRKAEVLVYEPVQKWLTGIAIVAFN